MLEKINLRCKGLKTIKVKNLNSLRELKITSLEKNNSLEIVNVSSLDSLFYYSCCFEESLPFNTDSLGYLKELCYGGVIKDGVFFDMIASNLPFLETLTLQMRIQESSLDITCYSLKRLTLICQIKKTDVKVFAPKLLFFCYIGNAIPSLVFPAIPPEQITLKLTLSYPIDHHLFLLEMREVLNLSSKFNIEILDTSSRLLVPLDFDLDDLRRRLPLPAMNVQQLSVSTCSHERLWGESPFFETFFLVCHPTYVKTNQNMAFRNKKYFRKLMVRDAVKKKIKFGYLSDVKDLKIRNPLKGNWERLRTYWKSFPDESAFYDWDYVEFQLTWCSP